MGSKFFILPFSVKEGTTEHGISELLKEKNKIILRGEAFIVDPVQNDFYKNGKRIQGEFYQLRSPMLQKTMFDTGVELTTKINAFNLK